MIYRLADEHTREGPVVYALAVGRACQQFRHIPRRIRGLVCPMRASEVLADRPRRVWSDRRH
jgi:hypothetical protein